MKGIATIVTLFCVLLGCTRSGVTKTYEENAILLTGIMQYLDVEEGCWQFITDDGEAYEIVGINVAPLHVHGLKAEIVVRVIPNIVSICMVGKTAQLLEIVHIYEE